MNIVGLASTALLLSFLFSGLSVFVPHWKVVVSSLLQATLAATVVAAGLATLSSSLSVEDTLEVNLTSTVIALTAGGLLGIRLQSETVAFAATVLGPLSSSLATLYGPATAKRLNPHFLNGQLPVQAMGASSE